MPSLQESVPGQRDDVVDLVGAGVAQVQLRQGLPDLVEALVAHPAQQQVLLDRRARVAAGVAAHHVGQPAELLGREVAADHLDLDGREALLTLRLDVRLAEALELAAVAVGAGVARQRRGGVRLLVVLEQQRAGVEVALGDPVALELLLDLAAQLLDAELVDEHLDARAGAVGAQPVLAVEDAEDGLGPLQVLAVVGAHELAERGRDARHDRGAAADAQLEALDAVAHPRDVGDVVDAGDRAVLVGGGEGGLHLARHQLRLGVAHEVAHVGAGPRSGVEQLALGDARPGVAGHVADGVAAALARRQAGVGDLADQLRRSGAAGCGGSGCSGAW